MTTVCESKPRRYGQRRRKRRFRTARDVYVASGAGRRSESRGVAKAHVLARNQFHSAYCDRDLLATIDTLLLSTRDHFVPASAGGQASQHNIVPCCRLCNDLKSDYVFETLEDARAFVVARRRSLTRVLAGELHPSIARELETHQRIRHDDQAKAPAA